MDENKHKIKKIKRTQLIFFGIVVLCWISFPILEGYGIEEFLPIPIGLTILSIVIEIVLAVIMHKETGGQTENNNNDCNKNPRPYNAGNTSRGNTSHLDKKVSDTFIKEIDDYVSREFPELPLDNAKISLPQNDDYLKGIRKAAFEMQTHLGISTFIITISIKKLNGRNTITFEAGHFKRTGFITAEIEIDSNLPNTMALACLAHEMSHAYQSFKGKQPYEDGSLKEEQFTDLLTYYLGFSNLIKNGYESFDKKLGYVGTGDFNKIEEQYSTRTSSLGSYKYEKKELKEIISLYETLVEETISLCKDLLSKYLSPDDKSYIKSINEKYSSTYIKEYISKIKENIDRRAKLNINMDQIGVEMKLEELMEEKSKVKRIHDYVFND